MARILQQLLYAVLGYFGVAGLYATSPFMVATLVRINDWLVNMILPFLPAGTVRFAEIFPAGRFLLVFEVAAILQIVVSILVSRSR